MVDGVESRTQQLGERTFRFCKPKFTNFGKFSFSTFDDLADNLGDSNFFEIFDSSLLSSLTRPACGDVEAGGCTLFIHLLNVCRALNWYV